MANPQHRSKLTVVRVTSYELAIIRCPWDLLVRTYNLVTLFSQLLMVCAVASRRILRSPTRVLENLLLWLGHGY
jgi:hypothetical protein